MTGASNQLDKERLSSLTSQVSNLKREGYSVVIVSSGAIACGMRRLGYKERPRTIVESSAAAAIGQVLLMHDYEQSFQKSDCCTAQILLTSDGLHDRTRYLNARNTIMHLLEKGNIVPIVNENDAVSTDEIKFGDNDRLSSLVATLIDAHLLIILSDVDGFQDAQGVVIREIHKIDSHILGLAGNTSKEISVGGMITKLEAAKIVTNSGIPMVIANGNDREVLLKISRAEEVGSWFLPRGGKMPGKKRWIAFSCRNCGKIVVDDGAREAIIKKGRSLLAIGIVSVKGEFSFGDLVIICDKNHLEIARGLTNYSSAELEKIKGMKTDSFEAVLGYYSYEEVVHRDNLVILH